MLFPVPSADHSAPCDLWTVTNDLWIVMTGFNPGENKLSCLYTATIAHWTKAILQGEGWKCNRSHHVLCSYCLALRLRKLCTKADLIDSIPILFPLDLWQLFTFHAFFGSGEICNRVTTTCVWNLCLEINLWDICRYPHWNDSMQCYVSEMYIHYNDTGLFPQQDIYFKQGETNPNYSQPLRRALSIT